MNEVSDKLIGVSGDQRAGFFFAQRLSLAVLPGNAASVLGTMPCAALPLEEEARFNMYPTTNPATPATEPDAIHESQTSPNLQKHWTLYDIRPCFIPLVPIDSVEYRSQNKNSTAKMRKPIDSVTKENRSENKSEKPHVCDVCKKQFGEKYLLKYHKRLHTGETAYTCRLCSKTFNHISNLKRHIRAHENKPFACEICNQHFSKQSNLNGWTDSNILQTTHKSTLSCSMARGAPRPNRLCGKQASAQPPSAADKPVGSSNSSRRHTCSWKHKYILIL
ncbi:hypothetical protein MSG28_015287 [Choristoneura fumiferana]|uniref:Uncharacterized protein n=1 Tax=Choristoneura fumiferana TaxID=7141 RepID=A0ACC0KA91_CHOFU|nr:hypothetical protein MSG28_015287 [Choristoneura fumiferana]